MWGMSVDVATHIRYIKEIINNGYMPADLFYPITHIYICEIFQISNIKLINLHKFVPLFFGILFILFSYIFAKSVLENTFKVVLATIISLSFLHSYYLNLTPNHLSILFFPLLLYVLFKLNLSKTIKWELISVIIVILFPVFHPVSTISLLVVIGTLWIPNFVASTESFTTRYVFTNIRLTLILLTIVWFITWISSFGIWDYNIKMIYMLLLGNETSYFNGLIENAKYASSYGYNVTEQVFKILGGTLFCIFISFITFPFIFNNRQKNTKINIIFSLYGPFFTLCLSTVIFYFFNFNFGPLRFIAYIDVLCIVFVSIFIFNIIQLAKNNSKYYSKFLLVSIILLLTGLFMHGALKLYPSPYILENSYQTTHTQVEGMDWFFNHRNLNLKLSTMPFQDECRFSDLLLSSDEKKIQKIPWYLPEELRIPFHFGYDQKTSLSEFYKDDTYLALTMRDKSIYNDVYPEMSKIRWTSEDFIKINYDSGVNKLYTNSGIDIYLINSIRYDQLV
ncbi:MAG: hypothetical protein PHT78_06860 [Desulfitobacteriaceae bacterium]|nr:hypothetical protein [Desulfitobacteriaceae bacterium]